MKVKEESEIVGLKLNTQKTKIMASNPITSWQIDGDTVTLYILGPIIPESRIYNGEKIVSSISGAGKTG